MTLNEFQYWFEGFPMGVSLPTGVDTGGMQYWHEGFPFVYSFPSSGSAPTFVPITVWFN